MLAVEPAGTASDFEETITMIPGVSAARLVVKDAQITEAHVLGDGTRHPMQLVRDIESSLLARYHVRIDRKRISVAQVEPAPPEEPRIVLSSIVLSIAGNEAEVRAEMEWEGKKLVGSTRGPATSRSRLALACQAVITALSELLPPKVCCALETVDTVHVGGQQAVLVLVSLIDGQRVQSLPGAAFVRRDETEAAGRASLAAINRSLLIL